MTQLWTPTRDFIGYGANPPHPHWLGEARVALQMVINYEEGSEYNNADGDGRTELGLAEAPGGRVPAGQRDMGFERRRLSLESDPMVGR